MDTIVVVQTLMIKNEMRNKKEQSIFGRKKKQRVVAREMAETEAEWHEQHQQ